MYKYIKYHINKFFSDFFIKCAQYFGAKLEYYGVKYFLRSEYICLSEIYFDTTLNYQKYNPTYNWDYLEKSIRNDGLRRKIHLVIPSNKLKESLNINPHYKYFIIDGNHRARVLRRLYGINHKVKVNIYLQEGEILKFKQW